MEDCRRWRFVILCKLVDSSCGEERFARVNLFWQALEEPRGDASLDWSQWGVVHGEVSSPGQTAAGVYLRAIRGKTSGR